MSEQEILDEAIERFNLASDSQIHNREPAQDDLRFIYLQQWDSQAKAARRQRNPNAPCLEFNKILKLTKKVTNQSRLNKPNVKISPEDDKADIKTAEKLTGLVRQTLKNSNFDTVLSCAFENSVESSFGYVRVKTKYIEDSFDQDIEIEHIDNPFSVYLDNESKSITGADSEWGFVTVDINKKEFDKKYPDATITSFSTASIGDSRKTWLSEDTVRVVEYYKLEKKDDRLVEGIDSKGDIVSGYASDLEVDKLVITRERKAFKRVWTWYKLTATDILDKKELAGPDFPIVAVYGRRKNINNKTYLFSLIRYSKDAQRMYNYWRSSEAERLGQSLKTPVIGAIGQFSSDPNWNSANITSVNKLEYDPVSIGGQIVPPPIKWPSPEPPIGYISAAQSSNQDIQETMGFDNPMLNNSTGETVSQRAGILSGVALDTLNQNGELGTYDFIDNLNKSARQIYKVIVNIIPKIYDTERIARILGEDSEEETVVFNGPNEDGEVYDLSLGRYDVDIDVGPDFSTRRKEAAESMMDFITRVPGVAEITGDLVAKSQDWKDSDKFAERIKKTIPPEIIGDEDKDENTLQIELAQAQQQLQEMQMQLEQALDIIGREEIKSQTSIQTTQMKEEGAMQRELLKSQTTLEKEGISTRGDIKQEQIQKDSDIITTLLEMKRDLDDLKKIVIVEGSQPLPTAGE